MRRAALLICIVLSLATGQAGGFQPEHDKAQRLLDNARELTTRLKSTADRDAVGMDQAADTAAVVSRYLKFRANMVDDPAMKDELLDEARKSLQLTVDAVSKDDPRVRSTAIDSLAENIYALDPPSLKRYQEIVTRSLEHPDVRVRQTAAAVVRGVIDDPDRLSRLLGARLDDETSPEVRATLIRAMPSPLPEEQRRRLLGYLTSAADLPTVLASATRLVFLPETATQATELLVKALYDPDRRRLAVQVLGESLPVEMMALVADRLADEDEDVRFAAAVALEASITREAGFWGLSGDEDSLRRLAESLARQTRSSDPAVRAVVWSMLGFFGPEVAAVDLAAPGDLAERDIEKTALDSIAAAVALVRIRDDRAAKEFLNRLITDGDFVQRSLLREHLGRHRRIAESLTPGIAGGLRANDAATRRFAMELAESFPNEAFAEPLVAILKNRERSEDERAAAINALGRSGSDEPLVDLVIRDAFNDPADRVRRAAISAYHADPETSRRAMRAAARDAAPEVAAIALNRILFDIAEEDVSAAERALQRHGDNAAVRAAALRILAKADVDHPALVAAAVADDESKWRPAAAAIVAAGRDFEPAEVPLAIVENLQQRLADANAADRLAGIKRVEALGNPDLGIRLLAPLMIDGDVSVRVSAGAAISDLINRSFPSYAAAPSFIERFWPPPLPTVVDSFDGALAGRQVLGDVHAYLDRLLRDRGYGGCVVFRIPGGFAILTRPERFDPTNGRPFDESERWTTHWLPLSQLRFSDMFWAIFRAPVGHFRFLLIAVTDDDPRPDEEQPNDADFALFDRGSRFPSLKLPDDLTAEPTEGRHCYVLIYHFRKSEGGRIEQSSGDGLQIENHLVGAGLWRGLGGGDSAETERFCDAPKGDSYSGGLRRSRLRESRQIRYLSCCCRGEVCARAGCAGRRRAGRPPVEYSRNRVLNAPIRAIRLRVLSPIFQRSGTPAGCKGHSPCSIRSLSESRPSSVPDIWNDSLPPFSGNILWHESSSPTTVGRGRSCRSRFAFWNCRSTAACPARGMP